MVDYETSINPLQKASAARPLGPCTESWNSRFISCAQFCILCVSQAVAAKTWSAIIPQPPNDTMLVSMVRFV